MNNTTNNTDTDLSSPFVGQNLSIAARALLATVGGIMILCGVLGNGLLIIVVVGRIRRRQHLYDLFLVNLALSDLVTLGYWMTFFVLDMILGYHPVVNQAHCVMNGMTICVMSGVCMLTLLAISVNRYLHVRHSRLHKRLFNWSRTVVICIVIWILVILVYIPPALNLGGSAYLYSPTAHQCTFETSSFSYTKLMIVSSTILSVIVIGYCNFAIFRFWKKASDALHGSKEQSGIRRLFNRRKKSRKEIQEEDAVVGPEESMDKERHQQEDREQNPIFDGEKEVSRAGASSSVDEPESQETQTESTATDVGRPDNDTESSSQAVQSLDNDRQGNTEGSVKTSLSGPSVGQCLQRQMEDGEDDEEVEDNDDSGQAEHDPQKDRESTRKPPPPNSGQTTGEASMTVAEVQTPEALEPSPSMTNSVIMTSSKRNGEKHPTSVIQKSQQRRKKLNSREVAFVRSLFVVFILACVAYIPFGIIMAVRSIFAVPAEVRILGLLLLFSNSSVNWVVYGVMNPSFREAYKKCARQLFGKCCPGKKD